MCDWCSTGDNGRCRCEQGAYLGAQLAGTPIRCERCWGLVDGPAQVVLERAYEQAMARLLGNR